LLGFFISSAIVIEHSHIKSAGSLGNLSSDAAEANDAEDKKNPLSDLEIVRILKDKYRITAARRTIAKYREEMGVPSSRLRKQY